MNLTNCFHFVMINHLSYFQNLALNWKTTSTNFRKAPSYHFNCFISQAPVLVKTLDLAGFTLRSEVYEVSSRASGQFRSLALSCSDYQGHYRSKKLILLFGFSNLLFKVVSYLVIPTSLIGCPKSSKTCRPHLQQ